MSRPPEACGKRLRQVVLVAEDLDAVVAPLSDALGLAEGYADPGVGAFGLVNRVIPIGDTFLEVVCPTRDDAPAARYRERQGGDGGYMLMLQTDDLAGDRERIDGLGLRVVWQAELDDIAGAHLHPKDTGGALLSLDQATPPDSWRWAGPDWREQRRTDVSRRVVAAELASPRPAELAGRWGEILALPVAESEGVHRIALDQGSLRFVQGPQERFVAFDVEASDRARAGESLELAGVSVRRV